MSKRLWLVQPSHYVSRNNHTLLKSRMKPLVPLTLPYLAALTPEGWDVTLIDEQVRELDVHSQPKPDLVALTTWTIHSIRAYDIADKFQRQGVPVIIGGPHVWFDPHEAAQHCDAIGIGEGEPIWARMLEDASSGRLQKVYRAPQMASLAGLPCPMQCDFCSERLYLRLPCSADAGGD